MLVGYSPESQEALAFRQGLREAGYVEGRDVVIEWRPAKGDYSRTPELAADLVQRKVDVIVVESTPAALAAMRATNSIPIVMALVSDPVGSGLVQSLARPGGNVTGLTNQTVDLAAKRLQLVKEAIPTATRVTVLFNTETPPNQVMLNRLRAAAPGLGLKLAELGVRKPEELSAALKTLSRANADAVYVIDDGFMYVHRDEVLAMVTNARLPLIFADTPLARRGTLLSYAVDHRALLGRAAGYVDRIFKGAKPADLPVEQPTSFELVINLRSAKVLGLTIPDSVVQRATEVVR
jgi:putative ABC transport system substrate-binding protein